VGHCNSAQVIPARGSRWYDRNRRGSLDFFSAFVTCPATAGSRQKRKEKEESAGGSNGTPEVGESITPNPLPQSRSGATNREAGSPWNAIPGLST